jgi:hypothetical protein
MRSYPRFSISVVSAGAILLLLSASPANAQCAANVFGFGDVGIVRDNPFQAEITVTRTGPPVPAHSILQTHPRRVARDAEGRVRSDAGTSTEQHTIRICDPIAQTLTQIDTLNSTAKIIHSQSAPPPTATTLPHRSFCSTRLPLENKSPLIAVEDLGIQNIEGVQAHGVRIKRSPSSAADPGVASFGEMITDRWCSDELSAVVLTVTQNSKSGRKTTIAMKNIERTEPDASLFQVPQNYSVTESVAEAHPAVRTRPAPDEEPQP